MKSFFKKIFKMKNFLKFLIKEFFGFVFRLFGLIHFIKILNKNEGLYYVFNYHSFSKYNNFKIDRGSVLETDYQTNFEKQIKFYKKYFQFSYPNEFFQTSDRGHSALITFDDGYKDNHDLALPILQKHDAKAMFFIVTSFTGTNDMLMHDKIRWLVQIGELESKYLNIPNKINTGVNEYSETVINHVNDIFDKIKTKKRLLLNEQEIKTINNKGFKIGVHTHNHKPLSFLNIKEQRSEIHTCMMALQNLNIYPDSIAYPNGLFNEDTLGICKKLNLKYGFTTIGGLNRRTCNVLKIKRLGLNVSDSINIVTLKIVLAYFFNKNE